MKIFCVGLPKTGTTSLGSCLIELGYKKAPYNIEFINSISDMLYQNKVDDNRLNEIIKNEVDKYEVFEDWPYPLLTEKIFTMYPDSYFILSTRKDEKAWLKSLQKHTKINNSQKSKRLRSIFYGNDDPFLNGLHYEKFYLKHNSDIVSKFKNNNKFLEICFETGSGWKQICEFLRKEIPNVPFPHANKSSSKKGIIYLINRRINRFKSFIKNI
jgi:hypothetical protein